VAAVVSGSGLTRRLCDHRTWRAAADLFAILTAAALPWSTSLTAVFITLMILCMVPFAEFRAFFQSLTRPISALPIALVLLALVGTLWSQAPWAERLHGINPTAKLLVLPFLFHHFERSTRSAWIFTAFLVSCALLSLMSWLVLFAPNLSLKAPPHDPGIFIKDYINQSQEFTLCAVALALPLLRLLRERRFRLAALLIAVALSFLVNMAFVVVSRTALVTMPIMLAAFALRHLNWRSILLIFASLAALSVAAWETSPLLHSRVDSFSSQYRGYVEKGASTSIGLRLEFWRKSLGFFEQSPLAGHGTGSVRSLFRQAATGSTEQTSSDITDNPHNQTLNVAVQWGTIGIILLYAMWIVHLLFFRSDGLADWIGFLVVVQNLLTSLFNSHLFDFHEGWMYVLGVGVAGGMAIRAQRARLTAGGAGLDRSAPQENSGNHP